MKVHAIVTVYLDTENSVLAQTAVAYALAALAARNLQGAMGPCGSLPLGPWGPYGASTGHATWDVQINE
jgi:hypothetical protein